MVNINGFSIKDYKYIDNSKGYIQSGVLTYDNQNIGVFQDCNGSIQISQGYQPYQQQVNQMFAKHYGADGEYIKDLINLILNVQDLAVNMQTQPDNQQAVIVLVLVSQDDIKSIWQIAYFNRKDVNRKNINIACNEHGYNFIKLISINSLDTQFKL